MHPEQLSKYKACLFDIDKTLTDFDKVVTPATVVALAKLRAHGMIIGACTGRHLATTSNLLTEVFKPEDIHILAGGGEIVRSSGEVLAGTYIEDELVRKVVEIVQSHHGRILFQQGRTIYGNAAAEANKAKYVVNNGPELAVLPLKSAQTWKTPIIVIGNITEDVVNQLLQLPIQMKPMKDYQGKLYADITALGVTKGSALATWCKLQHVTPAEVICFGDSENDKEVIELVGYGVAMGNAIDPLKAIAREVIGSCEEDGIAKWVDQVLATTR